MGSVFGILSAGDSRKHTRRLQEPPTLGCSMRSSSIVTSPAHTQRWTSCGDHGPVGRGMFAPVMTLAHRHLYPSTTRSRSSARFTGGSSATSCEDLMRAVLMFIGRWRLRPLAAAACYALRWSSSCVCELLIAQHMKFTTAVTHLFWEVAGAQ